jgi:glycosyltransferase involved in cell wall biosynthesis
VDIDDANHLRYTDRRGFVRWLCGEKHCAIWQASSAVVCGSRALLLDVHECITETSKCHLLPSVPPDFQGTRRPNGEKESVKKVGWIGSPSTAADLALVTPALEQLSETHQLELIVVGAQIAPIMGVSTICRPWSPAMEESTLEELDLGIMPVIDDAFRRRKCGFKIVQYMSAGVPVVASDVGGNRALLSGDGMQAGVLACTVDQWREQIKLLLDDDQLRLQLGADASLIASSSLCFQVVADQWLALLWAYDGTPSHRL